MRRITLWALSTITALVLLFSYHTSTSSRASTGTPPLIAQANGPAAATPTPSATATGGSTPAPSDSATPSSTPSATPSTSSKATTYDGDAVMTRFGAVQVQITVKSGQITASQVLQVPWNDRRDQEINSYAVPVLNGEVVQAQSSTIDMVSGATYTSDGYIQSLQSAIDAAHL